jgi:glycosyltransferase involved in cell wall biosynthesis
MQPLVSICIPAYNAERFIAETLESALNQTYPNTEVIVSDDASRDSTGKIVKGYSSRGVRLIKQPRNLGMHANWNAVIRASSGKYVLKLDADDLLHPDHVREQIKVFESYPEVVFAHCACQLIDVNGRFLGYERSIHGSFIRDGLEEWPRYVFGPRAVNIVMLRRSAFEQVGGYDERYRYSGDWAMHRSLLRIGSVFYNDQVLARYRVHTVGKRGVERIQAYERLMHLKDMELNWPQAVPNKAELLSQARTHLAVKSLLGAARCTNQERADILQTLPSHTDNWRLQVLWLFLCYGGAPIIRFYSSSRQRARLLAKSIIFKAREFGLSERYIM